MGRAAKRGATTRQGVRPGRQFGVLEEVCLVCVTGDAARRPWTESLPVLLHSFLRCSSLGQGDPPRRTDRRARDRGRRGEMRQ